MRETYGLFAPGVPSGLRSSFSARVPYSVNGVVSLHGCNTHFATHTITDLQYQYPYFFRRHKQVYGPIAVAEGKCALVLEHSMFQMASCSVSKLTLGLVPITVKKPSFIYVRLIQPQMRMCDGLPVETSAVQPPTSATWSDASS